MSRCLLASLLVGAWACASSNTPPAPEPSGSNATGASAATPTVTPAPTPATAPTPNPTPAATPTPTPEQPPANQPPLGDSIGTATLLPDGTIEMQLRATGAGGMVGDALIRYPPDHKNYAEVKKHLGPMTPGQPVQVKPFP